MHLAPLEERIYRHRCVEGWSIVVPWVGYSLSKLLQQVQPLGEGEVRGVHYNPRSQANAGAEDAGPGLAIP